MADLRSASAFRRHLPGLALMLVAGLVALALRAVLVRYGNSDVAFFRAWLIALREDGLDDDISTYPPLWSYLVLVSDAVLVRLPDISSS